MPVEVLAARGPVQPLAEAQVDVGAVGRGLLGSAASPSTSSSTIARATAPEPPPAVVLRQRPDRLAHVQEPVEQADVDDPQLAGQLVERPLVDERADHPARGCRSQELDPQPADEVTSQRRVRPLVPQPEARQREVDRIRHVPIMTPPVRP